MSDTEGNQLVDVNSEAGNSNEENPYAYLERDFSSENFKIELKNLPKYYGINEFRKLLNEKLKLNSNKIKAGKRSNHFAFVCFRNVEDRDNAIKVLSGYVWKGRQLKALKARPAPDPLVKKRKEALEILSNPNKKVKLEEISLEERLKLSTTPYWNKEYEEQIKLKLQDIREALEKFANELAFYYNPTIQKWMNKRKSMYGSICEIADTRYAEQSEGYRNKCEFSIGIDEETNLPTVGFRVGSYANGTTSVGPVEGLIHIPECMKVAVKVFQDYVRASDLKVFNPEFHTGHFRQLMARSAPDQLMLVVSIHPQDLTEEQLTEFKKSLVDYFTTGDGAKVNITSLYYQKMVKKKHDGDFTPAEHLWGDTHIYETILGLKFKISPEAFFQINTKGAEILYEAAIELAKPNVDSTVLDVCCGTGTIGLCFAKKCSQVLGLEIVPQAIIDAKENAISNNIENAEFFTGKAEDILGSVCMKATNKEIIAIVDPPRAGLHTRAICQLRKIPSITKIVYIACNPAAAKKNFVDLARPESKTMRGDPFMPVKAIPVDMFPYTKHCELVVCFERWDKVYKSGEVTVEENKEVVTDSGQEKTSEEPSEVKQEDNDNL